jgi:excisionase family DNA binding protein
VCYNTRHGEIVISAKGWLTVSEAARRLRRSEEQVRRNLRQGKLKGQRIGHQWFVDEREALSESRVHRRPLIPVELQERARKNRESMFQRTGVVLDVVADLKLDRESR